MKRMILAWMPVLRGMLWLRRRLLLRVRWLLVNRLSGSLRCAVVESAAGGIVGGEIGVDGIAVDVTVEAARLRLDGSRVVVIRGWIRCGRGLLLGGRGRLRRMMRLWI